MRVSKRQVGIIFIIIGILLFLAFQIFHPQIIRLLESSISADGEITPSGVRQLNYVFYIFTILILCLWIWVDQERKMLPGAKEWCKSSSAIQFMELLKFKPSPKFMLIASTAIGLFLIIHIRLYDPFFANFRDSIPGRWDI